MDIHAHFGILFVLAYACYLALEFLKENEDSRAHRYNLYTWMILFLIGSITYFINLCFNWHSGWVIVLYVIESIFIIAGSILCIALFFHAWNTRRKKKRDF
jgi:hypothetical protein